MLDSVTSSEGAVCIRGRGDVIVGCGHSQLAGAEGRSGRSAEVRSQRSRASFDGRKPLKDFLQHFFNAHLKVGALLPLQRGLSTFSWALGRFSVRLCDGWLSGADAGSPVVNVDSGLG